MVRYYLCDVIGDGSEDNPYRPAVADATPEEGESHSYVVNEKTGQCLAAVDRVNHAAFSLIEGVDAVPDAAMDTKVGAVNRTVRRNFEGRVTSRGLTKDWRNQDAIRTAIRSIGRQIDPNFHEDNFGKRP